MARSEDLTVNIAAALNPILDTFKATGIAFEALADIGEVISEVRAETSEDIAEVLSDPEGFDFENAASVRAGYLEEIQSVLAAIVVTDETIAKIKVAL